MNLKGTIMLGISASLLVCSQAQAREAQDVRICTKAAYQIAHNKRNGQQWRANGTDSVLLHLAGCDQLDDGSYGFRGEGVQSGHCNRRAYQLTASYIRSGHNIAADDASLIGRIWQSVTRNKHCGSFEDGTYYGK